MGTKESAASKSWEGLTEEARQAKEKSGLESWANWGIAHNSIIVDHGGPLGKTKLVNTSGVSDTKNGLCGYVIVRAESAEAAANLFLNHPHFAIFPGDSVEIVECLPIPGHEA